MRCHTHTHTQIHIHTRTPIHGVHTCVFSHSCTAVSARSAKSESLVNSESSFIPKSETMRSNICLCKHVCRKVKVRVRVRERGKLWMSQVGSDEEREKGRGSAGE